MDVPPVHPDEPVVARRLDEVEAGVRTRVLRRRPRAAAEDLLGAGAVDRRRPRVAVDEHHVVALAVPARPLQVLDLEDQADHPAGAGRVERDVVLRAVEVRRAVERDVLRLADGFRRPLLPPARVEPVHVVRDGSSYVSYSMWYQSAPIGRPSTVGPRFSTVIARRGERHREVRVQPVRHPAAVVHGHHRGVNSRTRRARRRRSRRAAPRPTACRCRPSSSAGSRCGSHGCPRARMASTGA